MYVSNLSGFEQLPSQTLKRVRKLLTTCDICIRFLELIIITAEKVRLPCTSDLFMFSSIVSLCYYRNLMHCFVFFFSAI